MAALVPVSKVRKLCDPLRDSPWSTEPVTRALVQKCLDQQLFSPSPVAHEASAELHAGRIAFLVRHGWSDFIEIDVGVPALGCLVEWPVLDGNHRLAAAIFRGDAQILASVDGEMRYAEKLLGRGCTD